ncbi:RNA polymerase sigma factor, partial [bacterium]|nr:RNA polymerase sigma factor [bacterium]
WRCEETVRKAIGFYFKGRKDLKKVDREDVYCEIRLEIYKSIEKFGGRGSFDSFIWRISERVIKKYLKCVKEKQKVKLCRDMSEYNAREEREERIKEVMIGIALLPRIYGEVLLKYKEGYSLEDISHLTGCPLGTIRWRYVEGLRKLRKILKGE